MVSKTEENNLEVLPDGDTNNNNFDPNLYEFKSHILTAKARVTPLRDKISWKTHQGSHPYHPQLHKDQDELNSILICICSRTIADYV